MLTSRDQLLAGHDEFKRLVQEVRYVFVSGAPKRLFLLQLCRMALKGRVCWVSCFAMTESVSDSSSSPPVKPLHPDASFSPAKLAEMERRSTEVLQQSLLLGQRDCLKTRPDGTILDGHHRIFILRKRGVSVDDLPREVVTKEDSYTCRRNSTG